MLGAPRGHDDRNEGYDAKEHLTMSIFENILRVQRRTAATLEASAQKYTRPFRWPDGRGCQSSSVRSVQRVLLRLGNRHEWEFALDHSDVEPVRKARRRDEHRRAAAFHDALAREPAQH